MDIGQRKQLDWLLTFLNSDLKKLEKEEPVKFKKAARDTVYYLYKAELQSYWGESDEQKAQLSEFKEKPIEDIDETYLKEKLGVDIFTIQDRLQSGMGELFKDLDRLSSGKETSKDILIAKNVKIRKCLTIIKGKFVVTEGTDGLNTDVLLYNIMDSLNGLSTKMIKRCADSDCRNWFIQKTRRKRKYCSNRCAARIGTRRINRNKN